MSLALRLDESEAVTLDDEVIGTMQQGIKNSKDHFHLTTSP